MCVYGDGKLSLDSPFQWLDQWTTKVTLILHFLILFEMCIGSKLDGLERVMGDVGSQLETSLVLAAPYISKLSQLLWPGLYKCLGALVHRFQLCCI